MIKNRSHIIYSLLFLCGAFVNYSFCQKTVSFDEVWSLRTNPNRGQTILIDEQQPNYFYFANKEDGVKIFVHNEPADPVQIKHFTHDSLGGMDAMNIFQLDSFLYVALGDFFSTESKPTGVAIIDISNPQNAFITDIWSTPVSFRGAPYLHTDGQNAWLCVMERGIVFLNVSDKSNIDSTTVYLPDNQWPVPDPTNVQLPNVRYVTLVDSLLYVCFDAGGLRVLDISNDENILEVGRYVNPLFDFTQQAYNTMYIDFPYAYIALDYCGFEIIDISNKDSIKQVSQINPWNCEDGVWLFNEGHANQIGFDAAHKLIYFSAGASEVVCYDVSDPASPTFAGQVGTNQNSQGAWGVTFHDQKVYLSYIETLVPFVSFFSGIKIFDVSIDSISTATNTSINIAELKIYPNPFSDYLQFEIDQKLVGGQLYISNLLGEDLYDTPITESAFEWRPSNDGTSFLTSGVYIISVSNKEFFQSYTISKIENQ